ncbi:MULTISPECIES: aminotransferase class V-fold PLP-dependent enzyme [unclassified Leifsonia]|uniref:aminotransferase class V-fold PLP-dependent enzyme n=1 Tax=unclassified Leifsonia TaxID=2663824 RepID=UPI0006FF424E|nr:MULTISPECIES: aminotransferase class V-fold PLP-dependent enzyme [unclassified Leifsonia]KQX07529.1 cysteine desulfurase [Leifsonia sp. Root1293]KRA11811.1 cysteine desulfurase [Leifsonia sp. Root60]
MAVTLAGRPGVVGSSLRVPLVTGGDSRYVNLDYAASAPALTAVADHVAELLPLYASVHRGAGYASQVSTSVYENARGIVGEFVNARESDVVVFTRNTTEALGLLASAVPGETVLLDIEHHANLLPWQRRAARIVLAADTLAETLARLDAELAARPAALVTVTGASNVTGETMPLRAIATIAHRRGARLAVDGAQLVPHRRVDLLRDGVDYLAFSGHKVYAPFGAGVLVGRKDWLDAAPPLLQGGGAVVEVTLHGATWHPAPSRHEAGSPNVVGVAALARAVSEIGRLDADEWVADDRALRGRLVAGLEALPGVHPHRIFSDSVDAVGVVSFSIDGTDAGLVAAYLSAEHGIGVRDGRFCAHPLLARLGVDGPALRASFGVGSTDADIDALLGALTLFLASGPAWRYEYVDGQWTPVDDARPRPDWAPARGASAVRFGCAA